MTREGRDSSPESTQAVMSSPYWLCVLAGVFLAVLIVITKKGLM